MGMNTNSSSNSGDPEVMADINTTPLIDVMLVLLIMLIITIPIQLHAVNLDLPVGSPPPSSVLPDIVKIDIDAKSTVYWQGVALTAPQELETRMQELAAMPVRPEVHIRPDKAASYETFARVLSDTRRFGLNKVGVIGSEQFLE
ncbi:ExbD/TolR family protein [Variovorax paradoxus]|uniref:Biopolymer transport protein ExbD n=1 Tax=Variovorax paradoxus TaxID=34073 RepID=A0A0H2M514_VARPD|nr:biopolymer transporter ExbD [Variovorax paradoxus]KLN57413.1 biopolymer transport protein ExbD [Variovorax paradoxus]